jgi:hypothetical protein
VKLFIKCKSIFRLSLILLILGPVSTALTQGEGTNTGTDSNAATGISAPELQNSGRGNISELKTASESSHWWGRGFARLEAVAILNADKILHRENRLGTFWHVDHDGLGVFALDFAQIRGTAKWADYRGYKVSTYGEFRINDELFASAALGIGSMKLVEFFSRHYGISNTLALWRTRAVYTLHPGTELRLEGNNDFAYVGWLDNKDQPHVIQVQNIFTELESFSISHWQLRANAKFSFYGDENQQQIYDSLILRDVFTEPFVFRAGVGGGWLTFKDQHRWYWSPRHFDNYGLRFAVWKRLLKFWTFDARYNLGYRQQTDGPKEKDSNLEVHLNCELPSGWLVSLNGIFYEVNHSAWWRNEMSINVNLPL